MLYTLDYSTEYGTTPSSEQVSANATLTASLLPTLTAAEGTFVGWYWDALFTDDADVGDPVSGHVVDGHATLYAKWNVVVRTIFSVDLDDFAVFNNLSAGNYSIVSRAKSSSAVTSVDSLGVEYQNGIYDLFMTSDNKDFVTSDNEGFEVLIVAPDTEVPDANVTVTILDIKKYEADGQDTETARLSAIANGDVISCTLADFINYSLPAEMYPTPYISAALCAQDVATRTYLFDRAKSAEMRSLHGGAMICNSYNHCLSVLRADEYEALPENDRGMCEQAQIATDGKVLTYNGDLINASYHSCAYKKTVSHQDYYDTDYATPYLTSVTTYPYDDRGNTEVPEGYVPGDEYYEVNNYSFSYLGQFGLLYLLYRTSRSESYNDMLVRLFGSAGAADIQANGINCATLSNYTRFNYVYYNSDYRVDYVNIWGRGNIPGRTLRSKLGLKSSSVKFEETSDHTAMRMTTYGSGHGVGMSQQGAKTMGRYLQKPYQEILRHYYRGTQLTQLTQGMLPT